jgi:hypothetical protein
LISLENFSSAPFGKADTRAGRGMRRAQLRGNILDMAAKVNALGGPAD